MSLENVIIKENESMLVGTAKVKNLSFHKEVLVRSTWDNWKTQQDTICTFTPVSIILFRFHLYRHFISSIICYYVFAEKNQSLFINGFCWQTERFYQEKYIFEMLLNFRLSRIEVLIEFISEFSNLFTKYLTSQEILVFTSNLI